MTDQRPEHELPEHAAEAKGLGRILDVVALQMPSGDVPHRAALDAAKEITLEGARVLSAYAASVTIPGTGPDEKAGLILAVRQGPSGAKDIGTAVARATGLIAGVATGDGHAEMPLDDLVIVAMEGLGVARSDGGDQAIHSELYDLVQVLRGRNPRPVRYDAPTAARDEGLPRKVARPVESAAPKPTPVRADADLAATGIDDTEYAEIDLAVTEPSVNERGVRVESDDPFAYVDTRSDALSDARALALTRGIAPGEQELAELARSHFAERDALRDELAQLQADARDAPARGTSDVQERRIKKLLRKLEDAEAEIEKLRAHQESDPGLASFFTAVQGLDPDEPNAQAKRGMLDKVFRKNVGDSATGAE